MLLLQSTTIVFLLISSFSASPLIRSIQNQVGDQLNKTIPLVSDDTNAHIHAKENERIITDKNGNSAISNNAVDANDVLATAPTPTNGTLFTAVNKLRSSDDGFPWYGYLLIALFILCCCCGGAGASKARTGRWVPARVWVED